jgi:hypothetical protein
MSSSGISGGYLIGVFERLGAPVIAGGASSLRVATGVDASLGSKAVAAARPPSITDGAGTFKAGPV